MPPDYVRDESIAAGDSSKSPTIIKPAKAQFVRVGDFLKETEEDVPHLVEGILRVGSTVLVAAKPKVGKSSWLMTLALAVNRGAPFLGRPTKKGVVLYVALEGNIREWRARLREMGGIEDDRNLRFYVGQAPPEAVKWLRENAEEHKPVLIIIDTLQRLIRLKDMNDYAAVTNASGPIIEIAQTFNSTLALAHHEKKNGEGDDGDSVRNTAAAAWTRRP